MGIKKKKILTVEEFGALLDSLDIQPILASQIRQVRWLYNNCNKCLMVYEEKLVRLMVHRLTERIKELEDGLQKADKYLSETLYENGKPIQFNSIGAGSKLHNTFKKLII